MPKNGVLKQFHLKKEILNGIKFGFLINVEKGIMSIKKLYLAGPMRGYPEDNYPHFNEMAAELRKLGYAVFNPAENNVVPAVAVDVSTG